MGSKRLSNQQEPKSSAVHMSDASWQSGGASLGNALLIFESSQSFDYSWLDASAKCINKVQTERKGQYIVLSGSYAAAFEQDYERLVVSNMYLILSNGCPTLTIATLW